MKRRMNPGRSKHLRAWANMITPEASQQPEVPASETKRGQDTPSARGSEK